MESSSTDSLMSGVNVSVGVDATGVVADVFVMLEVGVGNRLEGVTIGITITIKKRLTLKYHILSAGLVINS